MTTTELIIWAQRNGVRDEHIFALAVGCAAHGPDAMDCDIDTLMAYCTVCTP